MRKGALIVLAAGISLACARTELDDAPGPVAVDLSCHPGSPPRVLASGEATRGVVSLQVDASRAYFSQSFGGISSLSITGGDLATVLPTPDAAPWVQDFALTGASLIVAESSPTTLLEIPKGGGAVHALDVGGYQRIAAPVVAGPSVFTIGYLDTQPSILRLALDDSPPVAIVSFPDGTIATGLMATSSSLYAFAGAPQTATTLLRVALSDDSTAELKPDTLKYPTCSAAPDGVYCVAWEPTGQVPTSDFLSHVDFMAEGASAFVHLADIPFRVLASTADSKFLYAACDHGPLLRVAHDGSVTTIVGDLANPGAVANDAACIYVADGASIVRYSKP